MCHKWNNPHFLKDTQGSFCSTDIPKTKTQQRPMLAWVGHPLRDRRCVISPSFASVLPKLGRSTSPERLWFAESLSHQNLRFKWIWRVPLCRGEQEMWFYLHIYLQHHDAESFKGDPMHSRSDTLVTGISELAQEHLLWREKSNVKETGMWRKPMRPWQESLGEPKTRAPQACAFPSSVWEWAFVSVCLYASVCI